MKIPQVLARSFVGSKKEILWGRLAQLFQSQAGEGTLVSIQGLLGKWIRLLLPFLSPPHLGLTAHSNGGVINVISPNINLGICGQIKSLGRTHTGEQDKWKMEKSLVHCWPLFIGMQWGKYLIFLLIWTISLCSLNSRIIFSCNDMKYCLVVYRSKLGHFSLSIVEGSLCPHSNFSNAN